MADRRVHNLRLASKTSQTLLPAPSILHLAGELATGGADIIASGFASNGSQIMGHQNISKAVDGSLAGTAILDSGKRIEGNQVDLGRNIGDQPDQRLGMGWRI